ncbi:MAG: hypothetical protein ND807_09255 [Vicinamibacterales bacterium]|nr:hypothetical protein [Vicinamibacterales bacterium]
MRAAAVVTVAVAVLSAPLLAQEQKPVPKDSTRVSIPGCAKGYIFTVAPRTLENTGTVDLPEGMHLRMNGPKKVMAEIKAHQGSMIEISGLMKKGQYMPGGVGVGGGVRISPGSAPGSGAPNADQPFIDVEGWRSIVGQCPSR